MLIRSHTGGTAASRISKEPTTAPPTRTRPRHPRGRSYTVTAAFLWTARVCRSSRARIKHKQVKTHPQYNDTGAAVIALRNTIALIYQTNVLKLGVNI